VPRLNNGDAFPALTLDTVGHGRLSVTTHLGGAYGAILMYRGSWCPYCNAQLAAFARARGKLDELGIRVLAMSVDNEVDATRLVEKYGLDFAVGYGIDADEIAASTGAYVNDSPRYLQSTGFVLDPDGRVITAAYSSAAIGRLVAEDVVGFVRYVQSKSRSATKDGERT
jgi:peroxiredoxin